MGLTAPNEAETKSLARASTAPVAKSMIAPEKPTPTARVRDAFAMTSFRLDVLSAALKVSVFRSR